MTVVLPSLNTRLDLDALHRILYRDADRYGRLSIAQRDLAEVLGVTEFTLSRAMQKLSKRGAIRKLARCGNTNEYHVLEPDGWADKAPGS